MAQPGLNAQSANNAQSAINTQAAAVEQRPRRIYSERTQKKSKSWIAWVVFGLFVFAVLVWFFVFKEDDDTSGGGADPNAPIEGGCKDGEEMVGTKCLVKCEDGQIRVGEVCELVNLTADRNTERSSSHNTTTENNITIDAYGLGSWYKGENMPPLIKEINATWDGCKDACVADNSCKAFTRFHTTNTYNPGGRPCNLFSQNFPQSEVRSAVGGGWEGELANIVGR